MSNDEDRAAHIGTSRRKAVQRSFRIGCCCVMKKIRIDSGGLKHDLLAATYAKFSRVYVCVMYDCLVAPQDICIIG